MCTSLVSFYTGIRTKTINISASVLLSVLLKPIDPGRWEQSRA